MKEFGSKLEWFWFRFNAISAIDADLFEHNTNLKVMYIDGNPIRHIDPGFFTNMKKLTNIDTIVFELGCMKESFAASSTNKIETYQWNGGCTDETARKNAQMAPLNAQRQQSLDYDLCVNEKFSTSASKINSIENSVTDFTKIFDTRIVALNNNYNELKNDNAKVHEKINKLIEDSIKLKSSLEKAIEKLSQVNSWKDSMDKKFVAVESEVNTY